MNLLVSASIVASFVAGVAALFAPCCITVLLPSYLGSIFRERKAVFLMTFIFFLGILTVFFPLGLGSAAFGQFLSRNHTLIFSIGGAFLLILGLGLLLGKSFSLPFHVNPTLKNHHPWSVFTLGIFSGIATTCCAPVLAGVLALAALPGSIFWGAAYTVSYVLGMVTPLFILASVLDRTKLTQRFMAWRRRWTYSIGKLVVNLSVAEAMAGVIFVGMGLTTIWLAMNNRLAVHSRYQVDVNIFLTKVLRSIKGAVTAIPEVVWAVVLILALIGIIARTRYLIRQEKHYDHKP
ncbi:MAG: hypothetical protein HY567_03270 [Candidatus Kerfeldbacteria bacterium]|nr:hypothetical protein [Candidatus Kerfeldbacteria bacterium]